MAPEQHGLVHRVAVAWGLRAQAAAPDLLKPQLQHGGLEEHVARVAQ